MTTAPANALQIMVVENDDDSRKMLSMLLRTGGHQVNAVATMNEALQRLKAATCDVLLSDIGLPDGSGWELMRRLRDAGTAPPFALAMSGYGMGSDIEKSRVAGFRQHLIKPIDIELLERLLAEAAEARADR
jgi:CheY-like chemotaxis protein